MKADRITAVWQNGGVSAKLKVSAPKPARTQSPKTLAATQRKLYNKYLRK